MASLAATSRVFLAGTARRPGAAPARAPSPVRSGRPERHPRAGALVPRSVGTSFASSHLDSGADGATRAAADAFERVDDVVMGGALPASSPPRAPAARASSGPASAASRAAGSPGAGPSRSKVPSTSARTRRRAHLRLRIRTTSPSARTWKATIRTQNDRGEMVYQATFVPPAASRSDRQRAPAARAHPVGAAAAVRGPTVVPDVPPLSADQCAEAVRPRLIMSRFGPRGPMPEFREGPFRLALHGYGVARRDDACARHARPAAADNAGKRASENRGTRERRHVHPRAHHKAGLLREGTSSSPREADFEGTAAACPRRRRGSDPGRR